MTRIPTPTTDRRTVLVTLGSTTAMALAGCAGGDGDTPSDGSDGGTPDSTPTDTSATLEPVDVPEDAKCAVCGMKAANFPEWNAQAVHEDDTRVHFCTSGCATTYHAVPDRFAETDAAIAGLWVRDFESTELIDGTSASYALETQSGRVDDPMMKNPAPFAERDAAIAYVDEVEYLEEDDVVDLSAFDRDLATLYREKFLDVPEAVEVPADAECAVCGMKAANFPEWNAQAIHEDETRVHFCTSGCATTYNAVPDQFAETDADIARLWVRDFGTKKLIDGRWAYYALETDNDRVDDPMMKNPAPFGAWSDAVAYVDDVDYLTTDDVVDLGDFDRDLAEAYRTKFLN
ncbi:nitrous oxide reductase accessory protein NosL [Halobacteriales archaeon Cl-PHB]